MNYAKRPIHRNILIIRKQYIKFTNFNLLYQKKH